MSVSTVDTFEHDIAEEIKHKDASLSDVMTARNEIGNIPEEPSPNSTFLYVTVSILILCAVIAIGAAGYLYQTGKFDPFAPPPEVVATEKKNQLEPTSPLRSLSLTLSTEIGDNIQSVRKTNDGYILILKSYPPVFSYMVRNESSYIQELAEKVYIPNKKPINPKKGDTVETNTVTTTLASTTQSTSTQGTSTPVALEARPFEPSFSDITINNQNMRVWTYASGTVVYAFVNTQILLVSSTTEGILALRNVALQKK